MDSSNENPTELSMSKDTLSSHPIFSRDPSEWMDLVHSRVVVSTDDGSEHTGLVYTVDPVSQTIVLVNVPSSEMEKSQVSMDLIMGPSVTSLNVLSGPSKQVEHQLSSLFRPLTELSLSEPEVVTRKLRLKSWLEKHRLPVMFGADGQSLTIADALVIQPPYTEGSCLSTNEIILSRIQGLIKCMPHDYEISPI